MKRRAAEAANYCIQLKSTVKIQITKKVENITEKTVSNKRREKTLENEQKYQQHTHIRKEVDSFGV